MTNVEDPKKGVIVPMERRHAREVAELHYEYTKSLLRDLGRRMCIVFYENVLKSDNNFGYVYVENSKVLGFIIGAKDNSKLFKNRRIRLELCLSLIRKPHLVRKVIFHLRNEIEPAPEGLYSAVDVSSRSKGIGIRLYKTLNEGFKERGMTYFVSRIDADNKAALILRRMLGARIRGEFFEDGRRRYLLYTELKP